MSKRTTAIMLAFFLGGFGIHKFYMNKPGTGIVYFLFCMTLIPAILAFFEALSYISMSDKKFEEKYFNVDA